MTEPAPLLSAELTGGRQVKVRFLLVGVWNTIVGYLIFVGLDALLAPIFPRRYLGYMSAAVLSNVLSIINAYLLHKFVTFRSQTSGLGWMGEFARFSTTYLATFGLSLVLLPLFVEGMKVPPRLAAVFVIVCSTLISYIGHRAFSFRPQRP